MHDVPKQGVEDIVKVVLGERPDLWEEGLQGRRVLLVEDGMMNCRMPYMSDIPSTSAHLWRWTYRCTAQSGRARRYQRAR